MAATVAPALIDDPHSAVSGGLIGDHSRQSHMTTDSKTFSLQGPRNGCAGFESCHPILAANITADAERMSAAQVGSNCTHGLPV